MGDGNPPASCMPAVAKGTGMHAAGGRWRWNRTAPRGRPENLDVVAGRMKPVCSRHGGAERPACV